MAKKLKVSMLLLLVVVMLLGNATCVYARGMVCDGCGALQDFESKMSNTMWACECDE